ncbi:MULTISPECIES: polysialyltransferase family glycosyltransferase [unclassified Exiguobacterium]|uniref:polysialyltransferase family glycosyltransferase n=1 Tax=unclassified Exiguobacterium TaxID=2644629 RepID=UPI001BE5C5EF|nr:MULTISPECIES: polysialyltransferase family glycosyltransferase [unclassified Exiguobacterium]
MDNSRLFFCSTYYHLYETLKIVIKDNEKTNVIILTTHDKEMKKLLSQCVEDLSIFPNVTEVIFRKRIKIFELLGIEKLIDKKLYKKKLLKYNFSETYLFTWNPYYFFRTSNLYFKNFKSKKTILIQESKLSYLFTKPSVFKEYLLKLMGVSFVKDKKNMINEVRVSDPKKFEMIDFLNLKDINNFELSSEDKKNILDFFIRKKSDFDRIIDISKEKVIILTQPLSEDGYESEDRKIYLYEEIVDEYKYTHKIFIKPHPRDTSDYSKLNVTVINKNFPSELFEFVNVEFDVSIGVCTSAVYQIPSKKKININESYFEENKKGVF